MTRFHSVTRHVFDAEGDYSNHPNDPGGATKHGISQVTLSRWLRRPATIDDVKSVTRDLALRIYHEWYWRTVNCDEIPQPFDMLIYHMSVNAGPYRAATLLQRAIVQCGETINIDGQIGPTTLMHLRNIPAPKLVSEFSAVCIEFYKSLDHYRHFGRGWINRVRKFQQLAQQELTAMNKGETFADQMQFETTVTMSPTDRVVGGEKLTGFKTTIGAVLYTAVEIVEAMGYIGADIADPLSLFAAGLAGVGMIAKIDRWLGFGRTFIPRRPF